MPRPSLPEMLRSLDRFTTLMRQRIEEEEHAGRREWGDYTPEQLVPRLAEQFTEILSAAGRGLPSDHLIRSCADLANYALIFADTVSRRGAASLEGMVAPEYACGHDERHDHPARFEVGGKRSAS